MAQTQSSGPNPPCEVGRTHPRDRHRMKPLPDYPGVWECARHEMFARVVPQEAADKLERGDTIEMHSGGEGAVVRHGDERLGGVLIYYRAR